MNGGRFDFDDGGTYCGGWEDGKAHGHGVCTGPKGQGEYAGAWHYGFEVSGIYVWPSGNTYGGQWQNGKRHGLGVEQRGRWLYRGEWTQGYKGRYGIRQSTNSHARYEGTWSSGLQDGYGTETYADGGTFQGQWLRGMRHGYGIRKSAAYGVAAKFRSRSHAHASLTSLRSEQGANDDDLQDKEKKGGEESRGGFVLRARSDAPQRRRRSLSERTLHMKQTLLSGLRIKKQKSTGDIHARVTTGETPRSVRSSGSTMSCASDESGFGEGRHDDAVAPAEEHVEPNTVETYMGEWKNDKRSGFGISERSDGLKYEGEWFNNKKFGYGVTTMKDGTREEGKYKNNVLVTSQRKKHLLFVRSSKLRERIDAATQAANRAAQIALQKADIAISRMATARDRAEQADYSYEQARADSDLARIHAKQFDPTFLQPGTELMDAEGTEMLKRGQPHHYGNHVPHFGGPGEMGGPQQVHRPAHMRLPHQESTASSQAAHYDSQAMLQGAASHEQMLTPFNTPPTDYKHPADAVGQVEYPSDMQTARWSPSPTSSPDHVGAPPETVTVPSVIMPNDNRQASPSPTSNQRQPTPELHAPAPVSKSQSASVVVHNAMDHAPLPSTSKAVTTVQQSMVESGATAASSIGHKNPEKPQQQVGFKSNVQTKHFTPSPHDYADNGDGDASMASSRTSLNLWNDHFDQYARLANPGGAMSNKRFGGQHGGGGGGSASASPVNVPSFGPLDSTPGGIPGGGSTAGGIIRRTTLSSTRDWQKKLAKKPPVTDDSAAPSTSTANHTGAIAVSGGGGGGSAAGSPSKKVKDPLIAAALNKKEEEKGSLPDVRSLNTYFGREDASRMSHQRRQEIIRMREEEELLQTNPLRYLFHPAVREWVIRWKLPLLVVLVNMCLSIMFYQLLTYSEDDDDIGGDADD